MKTKIKKITKNISPALVVKASTSRANKTGSWRTYRPLTDNTKCIGCSLCAKLCPEACIEMLTLDGKTRPQTDYDFCKGCGLCAAECPVKAIIMEKDY